MLFEKFKDTMIYFLISITVTLNRKVKMFKFLELEVSY